MSENKLSFLDLQRFLIKEMEMHANYQPIMIKTLLNSPRRTATIDEIADKIRELNPAPSVNNFRNIPVYEVLTNRGIVNRDGDKFILNTQELTNEQSYQLSILCNWKTENIPLEEQIKDLTRAFDDNRTLFNPDRLPSQDLEKLRAEFVSDYSTERISKLKLDEYVTGKRDPNTGAVNKSTFCYRLENIMDRLSSFGIQSALDFGVYYSKETQKYEYKGDYSSADVIFDKIKIELKSLIEAGELYHIDHNRDNLLTTLNRHHILPKNVQSKILSLYYPEDFVHIHSLRNIQAILQSLGVAIHDIQPKLFLAQAQLLEIKNADPIMKQWNNSDFSHFAWHAVIARASKGRIKGMEQIEPGLFLTAYDNENLKTSKNLGILGWEQHSNTLAPGDYVFVFNTNSKQIETCFEVKMRSEERKLIWQDEVVAGKLKFTSRLEFEISI